MSKSKIKETDKLNIFENREINISSGRAYIQMIILLLSVPVVLAFFFWLFIENFNSISGIVAIISGFVFSGMMIFFLTKLHTAKIVGKKLKVKSIFEKSYEINVINIVIVNTFRFSGASYLSIKYKKFEVVKNIWILKPSIFSGGSDVEKVIKFSMNHFKLKNKEVNN